MPANLKDLEALNFRGSRITVKRLNYSYSRPEYSKYLPLPGRTKGPFCVLDVASEAPVAPGVFAWAVDDKVQYVAATPFLLHVVKGYECNRLARDFACPPPRRNSHDDSANVRVNGLLNRSLTKGHTVTWWWLPIEEHAGAMARELTDEWKPPWNREAASRKRSKRPS